MNEIASGNDTKANEITEKGYNREQIQGGLNESLRKALALANAHSLASSLICGNGMD
jgi:hypothetical protein